ncbi:MAG: hypothetical protein WBX22_15810 [Silvibacterium sp.]|jgi:hypothetical protein
MTLRRCGEITFHNAWASVGILLIPDLAIIMDEHWRRYDLPTGIRGREHGPDAIGQSAFIARRRTCRVVSPEHTNE